LADSGTTQRCLGANRLSLGTGADGATPHYHSRSWELLYLVDGAKEFLLDDRDSVVEAGNLVLVPPRMPHAFGAVPRHLQRIALGQEPAESLAPVQDRYDVHFVDSGAWTTTRTPGKSTRASTFG
jgi:mannose-6-phosphate isomerase-like protein (cupin superfamily)